MTLIATHIAYYHICHRKLWLFANGITMEHTSETVAEGKLIHEISYPQRAEKYTEIAIGGSKIDFYDATNKVIHETKKSDKMESSHEWQVKYYIHLLEEAGVQGATGVLEYPRLRETKTIVLTDEDRAVLLKSINEIEQLIERLQCPARIDKPLCKKCSYYDFCYTD